MPDYRLRLEAEYGAIENTLSALPDVPIISLYLSIEHSFARLQQTVGATPRGCPSESLARLGSLRGNE